MRKFLLIATILITSICQAQETLFRIISVKGVVTLDEDTVTCNKRVTSPKATLTITGKTDYATILTHKGFAFLLGQGNYLVTDVSEAEHSNAREGVVHRRPSEIEIIKYNSTTFLFGDSLTVIGRSVYTPVAQYGLVITNMMEEEILKSTPSSSNIHTLAVSNLLIENRQLVFQMRSDSKKITSDYFLAKRMDSKVHQEAVYNFDCVNEADFIDRELSILALCEIHKLFLDQIYHLHKLWKYSQTTGMTITHAYYKRLVSNYELNKFLPVPLTGN
jgi:hypothetical protein